MDYQEIMKQLIEIEEYFEEGRKRVYNLRMQIGSTDSGAPLQENESEEAKLAKLLSKKANGKSSGKKDSPDKTVEDQSSVAE